MYDWWYGTSAGSKELSRISGAVPVLPSLLSSQRLFWSRSCCRNVFSAPLVFPRWVFGLSETWSLSLGVTVLVLGSERIGHERVHTSSQGRECCPGGPSLGWRRHREKAFIESGCVVLQKYTLSYRFQWVFSLFCTGMSSPRALKVDTAVALSEDSKKWYSRQAPSA